MEDWGRFDIAAFGEKMNSVNHSIFQNRNTTSTRATTVLLAATQVKATETGNSEILKAESGISQSWGSGSIIHFQITVRVKRQASKDDVRPQSLVV